jgi:glycosyltransferase involved in cell wall biosynthesis
LLQDLSVQTYPNYEIILVLDNCSDKTLEKSRNLNIKQLKIIELNNTEKGKKSALSRGIKEASGDFLVFTDADCRIPHIDWLIHMAGTSSGEDVVHIGISLIHPQSNSKLLNLFIQFETLQTAIQYIGSAIIHLPYMALGRNWGYTKIVANKLDGLQKHQYVIGGDDDLILQESAKKNAKVIPITHPSSINYSIVKMNLKNWWKQKHRHVGVGLKYSLRFWLLSAIPPIVHGLFYILIACLLVRGHFYFTSLLFIWRTVIFILTFALIGHRWKYSFSYIWIPCMDILYQCYMLISRLYTLVVPVKKWN